MSDPRFSGLDPARSRLRATVATLQHEIARLAEAPPSGGSALVPSALIAAWADLVGQLALGPEPEVRECPACHHVAMRGATVCSNCWGKLTPFRSGGAAES